MPGLFMWLHMMKCHHTVRLHHMMRWHHMLRCHRVERCHHMMRGHDMVRWRHPMRCRLMVVWGHLGGASGGHLGSHLRSHLGSGLGAVWGGNSLSRQTRRNLCDPLLVARIPQRRRRHFDSRIIVFFSLRSRRTHEQNYSKTGVGQAENHINHVLLPPFVRSAECQKCLFCSI